MKLNAVHHVTFIVSDYEKPRDFYVNKLGFEIIRENYRPEYHDYELDLKCGTVELEVFRSKLSNPDYVTPSKRAGQLKYHIETCRLRHLTFCTNDVGAYKVELESMGIYIQPMHYDDYTGEKMTFFFDSNGLLLELYE